MYTLSAAVFADAGPFPAKAPALLGLLGGGVCFGIVFVIALVAFFLLRGGKKKTEPGSGLLEDLSAYPPPPPRKSQRRLTVQGRPSRMRLIVMAPVGKRDLREFGEPEDLLNRVVHGLGDVAREDRPRIRTWPPQLSKQGFAPSSSGIPVCRTVRRVRAGHYWQAQQKPATCRFCWASPCGVRRRATLSSSHLNCHSGPHCCASSREE